MTRSDSMPSLKPGDKLIRVCESWNGRPISRKSVTVDKITKAGFIRVSEDRWSKFGLASTTPERWDEYWPKSRGMLQYRIWLERP